MTLTQQTSPFAKRLLVVADHARLAEVLRGRYPALEVTAVRSFMSGIAELANGPVHAIVAYVGPSFGPVDRAVRGLREAAGANTPVILCCDPESEPRVRQALAAGASDYVIYPPDTEDLDQLLSLRSVGRRDVGPVADQSAQEIKALGVALEAVSDHPQRVLEGLAELLRTALQAKSALVLADGVVTRVGETSAEPVLREPIMRDGQRLGEVAVGESSAGPYTAQDIDKVRQYADLFAHVLHVARQQHDLKQLALTDELTELPNRRFVLGFLSEALAQAARERSRVTVCLFDIDDFKTYNDEFGHEAGDEILRASAQLFQKQCRPEDVVARYGGDEFVVVFWDSERPRVAGSQHPAEAMAVMRRFQQALQEHEFGVLGPRATGELTISGGLATYPWDAANVEDLLRCADQALMEAKQRGKSRIHLLGAC